MKTQSILLPAFMLLLGTSAALYQARAEIIFDDTPVPGIGKLGGPAFALNSTEMEQFIRGRRLFDHDWKLAEGVGTDLNGDSCRACHSIPTIGGSGGLDVNVFRFGNDNGGVGPFTDLPGGQIASKLRHPLASGREDHPLTADVFEQRNSPPIFGLGLIDDIEDDIILANEDPTDADNDGIFGIARLVDVAGNIEVGRFSWKAGVPHLTDFLADAMGNEVGITCPDNGRGFAFLTDSDTAPDPEMSVAQFEDTLFFMRALASPPRQGSTDPAIAQGEALFSQVGCDGCHTPTLEGPDGPIALYSNLLLHNIHPMDFRGMSEDGAAVGMYRTPPLWGARLSAPYLHDGSAESLLDAIQAHEGEAELVRQAFDNLNASEQEALLLFLGDL